MRASKALVPSGKHSKSIPSASKMKSRQRAASKPRGSAMLGGIKGRKDVELRGY